MLFEQNPLSLSLCLSLSLTLKFASIVRFLSRFSLVVCHWGCCCRYLRSWCVSGAVVRFLCKHSWKCRMRKTVRLSTSVYQLAVFISGLVKCRRDRPPLSSHLKNLGGRGDTRNFFHNIYREKRGFAVLWPFF